MLGKLQDSWDLFLSSWEVLRSDKELLVLPVLSGIACGAIMLSFWWSTPELADLSPDEGLPWPLMAIGFVFYFLMSFIVVFFNSALIWAAEERFSGGDPTIGSSLGAAWEKLGLIIAYAAIAASVGMIIKMVEHRMNGLGGQILSGLMGIAWGAATFLAIPVLVHRHVGPIEAIKESAGMLRNTWGQQLAGVLGLGAVFTVAGIALAFLGALAAIFGFGISKMVGWTAVSVVLLMVCAMGVLQMALTAIYQAALYRYARTGEIPETFDSWQMEHAFDKSDGDWKFSR